VSGVWRGSGVWREYGVCVRSTGVPRAKERKGEDEQSEQRRDKAVRMGAKGMRMGAKEISMKPCCTHAHTHTYTQTHTSKPKSGNASCA
jgi:hypothetical protein